MILHIALFSVLACLASSVQGEDAVEDIVGLVPPELDSSPDYWTGKRNLVPKGKLLNILLKGSPESERVVRDVSTQQKDTVDHDHKDHQHDHQHDHDHDHQHDHSGDAKKREKRGYCSKCGGQVGYGGGGFGGGGYGGYGGGGGCGNNCGGGRPIYQQPIYQRPVYQQPSYGGGGGICSVCGQPYGGGGGGGSYSSSQSSSSSSSGSYGK